MRANGALLILGAGLLAFQVGCDSTELLGPGAPQGINGVVLIGPQCPVQTVDNPCPDLPYQASVEVRRAGGGSVTSLTSGSDGLFRVGLLPGRYTLFPKSENPFPIAGEQEVVVEDGLYTHVTINFDTGIR